MKKWMKKYFSIGDLGCSQLCLQQHITFITLPEKVGFVVLLLEHRAICFGSL